MNAKRVSARAGDQQRLDLAIRTLARQCVREHWTAAEWHQRRASIVASPEWDRTSERAQDRYIMYLVAVQHMLLDHLLEHNNRNNHWYWKGTKDIWV